MVRFLSVLLLLVAQFASAADITVTPPAGVIQPNEYAILDVAGISDAELPRAIATVLPTDGVQLLAAKTWGGKPIIIFKAARPGKYAVVVALNAFRQKLDEGLSATEAAEIEPPELLSELRIAVVKITDKYQAKSGSALVEVAGTVPPPPPPPPVDGLASQLIILRDQTTTTTKKVAVMLDLQEKYQRGSKPEMFLLDKTEPSNLTKSYVALKPTTVAYPYYFLVEKGGRILAQGELAETTEANVAIIAKFQEKK